MVAWTQPETDGAPALFPPSLRFLDLSHASLPAAQAALSRLEMLLIRALQPCPRGQHASTASAIAAALPHLRSLTTLVVRDRSLLSPPPAELAQLSRLERLFLDTGADWCAPGPWQRSLRWVVGAWPALGTGSGLQFLEGCAELEQLQILGNEIEVVPIPVTQLASPTVQRFLRWLHHASCHGGLRRLTVGFDSMSHYDSE